MRVRVRVGVRVTVTVRVRARPVIEARVLDDDTISPLYLAYISHTTPLYLASAKRECSKTTKAYPRWWPSRVVVDWRTW